MKSKRVHLPESYGAALRAHLLAPGQGAAGSFGKLGNPEPATACMIREMAMAHEKIMAREILPAHPPRQHAALLQKASAFFAEAAVPAELSRSAKRQRELLSLRSAVAAMSLRNAELAAANLKAGQEIDRRKVLEAGFKKSERHTMEVLRQSELLKEQLRCLSRQMLLIQENERKRISRELHDILAQSLTGINISLATLKRETSINASSLNRNIARTQRMAEKSLEIVHHFARELRPPVLDDLGLVPALEAFLHNFTARTNIRASLKTERGVSELGSTQRTVLFRVAQEALSNVARHAQAKRVKLCLSQSAKTICLKITDDGNSFKVSPDLLDRGQPHLGLIGMRERVEMVGGSFRIESSHGQGTTITAKLPIITTTETAESNLFDSALLSFCRFVSAPPRTKR